MDSKILYLELLKKSLTRYEMDEYSTLYPVSFWSPSWKNRLLILINRFLFLFGIGIGLIRKTTTADRYEGLDWPVDAETMIGIKRLNHLHENLDIIRRDNIPGDLLEAGVWRGGGRNIHKGLLRFIRD